MDSIDINTYDYIVCGGGTSGCVVAGRLAENPNVKVLLLEAGQHNRDLENVHMVGGWANNFDAETDWNITSPPMQGVNNRQVKLSRGRFLGGCSGCNGTLCIRGCKHDFDAWGLPGWSGEEMFACMKKAETFHPKPWFQASAKDHGYSGPLHTEPHDPAPISQLILASFISSGIPLVPDMFSTGDTAHGCGHVPRTVYEGLRTTSADFITNGFQRRNVTILTGCTVDKVLVESSSSGDLNATGVVVQDASAKSHTFNARKEVIISSGAYCSPAILLRSGIGPSNELQKHGIPRVLDLPGVGQNLMDHPIVFMFYSTATPNLTTDHKVHHPSALEASYNQWKDNKSGFLSTFPFGVFAYARMDERLAKEPLWQKYLKEASAENDPMGQHTTKQPSIELFNTECYGGPKQYEDFPSAPDQSAFSIIVELFAARSRGSVTLESRDAATNPVVDPAFLNNELDLLVLSEGCRLADEIITKGAGTTDIVTGSWPKGLGYGENGQMRTRKEWEPYVKDHATTCYHAAGTCAMGKDNDTKAVLDNKLRVRGISNLRVADCSSMPTLHSGHTQMVAYGIGEKCAELIKETWKEGGVGSDMRAVL